MRLLRQDANNKRSMLPVIICSVVFLLVLAGGGIYLKAGELFGGMGQVEIEGPDGEIIVLPKPERMNVLLLGDDARRGEGGARTDAVMLVSVDPKNKQVSIMSIPRDTRVNIPGHGRDKLNHASAYGGPELTASAVSQLLGIEIKDYVLINFAGFKSIVDILGGLEYDVERDMYHYDPTDSFAYNINLKKGPQLLDGDKALQYVRFRSYPTGDIARTEYQQRFMVALAKELLQPSSITKLPKLIPEINRHVKTNLSVNDMLKLAAAASYLEADKIVSVTLPGRNMSIGGVSYWGVEPAEAQQALASLLGGDVESMIVMKEPAASSGSSGSGGNNSSGGNRNTTSPPDSSSGGGTTGSDTTASQSTPSQGLANGGIAPPANNDNNTGAGNNNAGDNTGNNAGANGAVEVPPVNVPNGTTGMPSVPNEGNNTVTEPPSTPSTPVAPPANTTTVSEPVRVEEPPVVPNRPPPSTPGRQPVNPAGENPAIPGLKPGSDS